MQYRKQRRGVYDEGLRVSHELREDRPPQRLQEATLLPHAAMQGGRVQPRHPREEVREEPLVVA
jgi:hypothetical protein